MRFGTDFGSKLGPVRLAGQAPWAEAEVAALHELMGDASFYRRSAEEIASTQKSLQELEARVATAYSRWQKLEQSVS